MIFVLIFAALIGLVICSVMYATLYAFFNSPARVRVDGAPNQGHPQQNGI
jgi:hypothetical protein